MHVSTDEAQLNRTPHGFRSPGQAFGLTLLRMIVLTRTTIGDSILRGVFGEVDGSEDRYRLDQKVGQTAAYENQTKKQSERDADRQMIQYRGQQSLMVEISSEEMTVPRKRKGQ